MAMSLRRAVRPLTGALHSLVPAAGARTAGARRTLALARPTEDADSVQFPREGPGLDYALNWSLCGDGVVPSKHAYRITKVQTAEQLLGGPPEAPAGAGAAAGAGGALGVDCEAVSECRRALLLVSAANAGANEAR